jgi:hypothetical protein
LKAAAAIAKQQSLQQESRHSQSKQLKVEWKHQSKQLLLQNNV